jgi:hypothetical protein
MIEQTGWAQDSLLELAFCDTEAPIRQRRSGKLQNQNRVGQVSNLYGLFTDLAAQLARRGGVIAYVTPTSFLAGEYFKSLRALLAEANLCGKPETCKADGMRQTLVNQSGMKRCESGSFGPEL